jgi:hypothetical protein
MRKRTCFITATIAALALGWGAVASAQSLAELASKEKERREKIDAERARSYTDEDLRELGGPLTTSTVAAGEAEPEEEGEDDEPAEDGRRTREYWQGRLKTLAERSARIESRLNRPGFDQNTASRSFFERQRLERELAEVRAEREALFEEARRAGVPPGWLR